MSETTAKSFVHLHLHTHYSLLDGLGKPEDYIAAAKEQGMPALAVTDHGVAFGLIDFYTQARRAGVQPILGVEAYVARFGRHQKRAGVDVKPWHLILLAESYEGYQNLLQLVTKSNLEGYYYKPRIDLELLAEYGAGLIATSACMQGEVPTQLLSGNTAEAAEAVARYQKIFGEKNFYLEIQHHPELPEQAQANDLLIKLGQKMGVPIVATNDCHYVRPEDSQPQDVLMCIQTGKNITDKDRMTMVGSDLSFRSPASMRAAFAEHPEACDATLAIAERCQVELPLGRRLIPTYSTPFHTPPEEYFTALCWDGLARRFGIAVPEQYRRVDGSESTVSSSQLANDLPIKSLDKNNDCIELDLQNSSEQKLPPAPCPLPPVGVGSAVVRQDTRELTEEEQKQIIARLEYELSVILKMGFANYFLIVWDFVKYAKEAGIAVGPGRGSAAGSLISYCLGITDLNPLKYGLLFERFLNPERVSMPDIDIDFADNRREEVLDYVREKYGRENVARIITFGTLAAKAAVKDAGRVFGVPFAEMNEFSKLIPSRPGTTLAEALEVEPELAAAIRQPPFDQIWAVAVKLEGVIRQAGVHACAVVIADQPLPTYTPLQYAPGKEEGIITQYSMHPIEEIGLLKMDFLGLRNLTIIQKCLNIIKRTRGETVDIAAIPMDDLATLELFARGETTGVFQFESSGMRRYLRDLRPSCFEDLIAMVALFRPGPMDNIPTYIRNKHNLEKIEYPHPVLSEHLRETYGIAVYQEQVQQIAQSFAGFTLGQGYMMIKAVAKKIPELLEEQRERFISGAISKGHTKKEAEKLFGVIEPFAGYGFNKSHAACYAYIAYQTGYLKARYPAEFMASLLTADHDNLDRLAIDIEECAALSIRVLPPSVNESLMNFTVVTRQGTGSREQGTGDLNTDSDKTNLGSDSIRFGLSAIKGLGEGPIRAILTAREQGEQFRDLADFASRVDPSVLNKRTLEALAYSGALDELGERAAIAASYAELASFAKSVHESATTDQGSLFGAVVAPVAKFALARVAPASSSQRLKWEKELLGMYISAHPLAGLQKYLSRKVALTTKLDRKMVGQVVKIGGIVTACRKLLTKKSNQMMVFLTLEDPTGSIEVSVFPKVFAEFGELVELDEMLYIDGRLEWRNDAFALSAISIKKVNLDLIRAKATESDMLDDSTGRARAAEPATPAVQLPAPFQIQVPAECDPAVLPRLKQLLTAAKSESGTPVEILIPDGPQKMKRISVPFKVGIGETLATEIAELLAIAG